VKAQLASGGLDGGRTGLDIPLPLPSFIPSTKSGSSWFAFPSSFVPPHPQAIITYSFPLPFLLLNLKFPHPEEISHPPRINVPPSPPPPSQLLFPHSCSKGIRWISPPLLSFPIVLVNDATFTKPKWTSPSPSFPFHSPPFHFHPNSQFIWEWGTNHQIKQFQINQYINKSFFNLGMKIECQM
jgi:hypothetical protein